MENKALPNATTYESRLKRKLQKLRWYQWHIDPVMLSLLAVLAITGLIVLYSASNSNLHMVVRQAARMATGFAVMLGFAQIPPRSYHRWALWFFSISLLLLALVLVIGHVNQGARRWISLGVINFQPSELMKLAMPMMLAYLLSAKPLPPNIKTLSLAALVLVIPVLLTAKQPDLGTAILIAASGLFVLILAGMSWKLILSLTAIAGLCTPILWHFMHQYQRDRVLTFLNPERDPLGTGYHIIQSKIAIGSGGFIGKGYLLGTQSHLQFLPAHATDFIFAVASEEFGLVGCIFILFIFFAILARGIYISMQAQNNFNRLLSGSLSLIFFLSAFINIGMVIGILPVVGVPLPLISYGGSSMLTMMTSFGIIMSIHTHRKLWSS